MRLLTSTVAAKTPLQRSWEGSLSKTSIADPEQEKVTNMGIHLLEPEFFSYKDSVTGESLNIYLKNSVEHIVTESAKTFFKNDAAKVARFLDKLKSRNPYWIDICDGSIQQVHVISTGLSDFKPVEIDFKPVEIESIIEPLGFVELRQAQKFLVKNSLLPASFFEVWDDPTGGLIFDKDSYYQFHSFCSFLTSLQDSLNAEDLLVALDKKRQPIETILPIFFQEHWQGKVYWIQVSPACTPTDFYDTLLEVVGMPVKSGKLTLKELRKQFWQIKFATEEKPVFVLFQALHFSTKVIDEIHDLICRDVAKFVLTNISDKNVQRLEELGEDKDNIAIELGYYQGFDMDFLHEIQSRNIPFEKIPEEMPLVFCEMYQKKAGRWYTSLDNFLESLDDDDDYSYDCGYFED